MAPQATLHLSDIITEEGDFEVPEGYGLWMRLNSSDLSVSIESVPDQHYPEIHPNCYAPADMDEVCLLHGGGSGTAVFHGRHPEIGSIVMKHGNAKDTGEVFALASINKELFRRSVQLSSPAARAMRSRIPEFTMVYMSPFHLRDRAKELWASLRGSFWSNCRNSMTPSAGRNGSPSRRKDTPDSGRYLRKLRRQSIELLSPNTRWEHQKMGSRKIRIRRVPDLQAVEMLVGLTCVVISIPEDFFVTSNGLESPKIANGIQFLQQLKEELAACQTEQNWKVTLAQKTIGGRDPHNGADVLTSGQLKDDLLTQLVDSFIAVMRDLGDLTLPNEKTGVDGVRKELKILCKTKDLSKLSKSTDSFVGKAIKKNYGTGGRFEEMRAFGERFREGNIYLSEDEVWPSFFLGLLLKKGNPLSSVFVDPPTEEYAMDRLESTWLPILELAASFNDPSVTENIWTCGLTDAGLHNTFLSRERGLELFDIGVPDTMPRPAFLTKLLMSFFHTAGMEDDGLGSWVRRFHIDDDKLALTPATRDLIPYLENTFRHVMDRLIEEIFSGDENVRRLLTVYVVLQLLSDGAFCLGRWEQKGGGSERHDDSNRYLEKWLWRSLWDFYIASHVREIFIARVYESAALDH